LQTGKKDFIMPTLLNTGTRDLPLTFAKQFSELVNSQFQNYQFSEASQTTNELLRFWFSDAFAENRAVNFHIGQQQAILNTIYAHEVLKVKSVFELYSLVGKETLNDDAFLAEVQKKKYAYPKYCMKMATGTGKTWVMHALLLWQYLNAKNGATNQLFSKNFLLVAPGLIVYERLLDAYLGKEELDGSRNFGKSDLKMFEELFIPPHFRDEVFGFIQSSVVKKDEIGKKVTGDGMIAITNWHLLVSDDEEEIEEESPLEDVSKVMEKILPLTPGTSAGNSLEQLDAKYLSGGELEFLRSLPDLVTINDEAHHIHENKIYGEIKEVEWQKSLTYIAEPKATRFTQIDFSATPYDVTGSGQNRTKHYFPHIVIDFDLHNAIHAGFVKTIALDKRKEIATMQLDFKAVREGKKVVSLSDGQRTMLRAGISKLKILEESFLKVQSEKHPKMFVICEDTEVSPYVEEFLRQEGFLEEEIMRIDSNKKGDIPEKEWNHIKQRLFNIDKHSSPKIIVSVLMLREGFDVNNICVIVPLRSAGAEILLEQTIGRGLRLMWREPEYYDIKKESRHQLLVEKKEPSSLMDILHIVEHPNFIKFYDELLKKGDAGTVEGAGGGVTGDIIKVGLKENYKEYDLYWPIILKDKEEEIGELHLSIDQMKPFTTFTKKQLQSFVQKGGDVFYSEEMTVKTRFGDYEVKANLFTAQSYNEFLGKLIHTIQESFVSIGSRKSRSFPFLQFNAISLVKVIDEFIREKLFDEKFDPLEGDNWRLLMVSKRGLIEHLMKEISEAVYRAQQSTVELDAIVIKRWFSEVAELKMRERYCLNLQKTIYEKQAYPSNKGGFEKTFMEFIDSHSDTIAFIKVNEHRHDFAKIFYVRADGFLAQYSPDFLVKTTKGIYIVETKAEEHLTVENVKQKKKAAVDWCKRVNTLKPEDRMDLPWSYILLGEVTFQSMKDNGASPSEMFEFCKVHESVILELF
jgi:type III restriction enzyme